MPESFCKGKTGMFAFTDEKSYRVGLDKIMDGSWNLERLWLLKK
jgi:hypothetical protein